jgi:hypothetical protein
MFEVAQRLSQRGREIGVLARSAGMVEERKVRRPAAPSVTTSLS